LIARSATKRARSRWKRPPYRAKVSPQRKRPKKELMMSASTLASARLAMRNTRASSPLLWTSALAFFSFFVLIYVCTFIDSRLFNGVSVWEKPAKFFLSLSLQMATLAWGLSLLPASDRHAPPIRAASIVFIAVASFEVLYITVQAAQGEASHFNYASIFTWTMYVLMGLGAVVLSAVTGFIGYRILRHAPKSSVAFGAGLGFILGGVLAVASGGSLSLHGSHWVGGDQTDAMGLSFFHWSTTGGDLRVAHFFGLHVMQALPLLGYLCRDLPVTPARNVVWGGAIAWVGLTVLAFIQAQLGRAFIGY
jgi:hypothetical protein